MELKLEDIEKAAVRLDKVIHKTPLEMSKTFSEMSNARSIFKI